VRRRRAASWMQCRQRWPPAGPDALVSTVLAGRAGLGQIPGPARPWPRRGWSAGDVQVVLDVVDAAGHPGGVYRCVVLGPVADVAGQVHRVPLGVHRHITVVKDQRVAVQRLLDAEGDVRRIRVPGDADLVLDAAHASEPGDGPFGRGVRRRSAPCRTA
jgi:hypothetical protein